MPPLDHIRRVGREAVERLQGQGDEVDFRHRADRYRRDNSCSLEAAQKAIWTQDAAGFLAELRVRGQRDERLMRQVEAGLNEMFSPQELEDFQDDGRDPALFRSMTIPRVTLKEIRRLERSYQQRFENQRLPALVLEDIAQQQLMINALFDRILPEIQSSPDNLQDIFAGRPELRADLGQILLRLHQIAEHERGFQRGAETERAAQEGREALARLFFEPVRGFAAIFQDSARLHRSGDFSHFFRAMGRTLVMLGRMVGAGSTLVRSLYTTLRRRP